MSGADLDIDEWSKSVPPELLTAWRPGERRGLRSTDSFGLNVVLAEGDDDSVALTRAEAEIRRLLDLICRATERGAGVEVDIGIEVQTLRPHSVRLERPLLDAVLSIGATVVVSAYPCSSDEDPE